MVVNNNKDLLIYFLVSLLQTTIYAFARLINLLKAEMYGSVSKSLATLFSFFCFHYYPFSAVFIVTFFSSLFSFLSNKKNFLFAKEMVSVFLLFEKTSLFSI